MKKIIPLSVLSLAMASAAHAAIVQVDFGANAPTVDASTWNIVDIADIGSAISLNDTTGSDSGIDLNMSIGGSNFSGGSNTAGSSGFTDAGVYADWIGGNDNDGANNVITIDITGLDAGTEYDFLFGSERDQANFELTTTFDGSTLGTSIKGDNYYTIAGFTGATSVQIVITDAVRNSTISALTITAIPEPGTYALLAGCLALTSVMIRRRRS